MSTTKQKDLLNESTAEPAPWEANLGSEPIVEDEQPTQIATVPPPQLPALAPTDPLAIIMAAVENPAVDADKMEKLLAMYERIEDDKRRAAYNLAMAECQSEMEPVLRDRLNTHTKAKYAQLETIDAKIRPIYTKHGFSLTFGTLSGAPAKHYRLFCDCRHRGGHVERVEADFPEDIAGINGTPNKTPIQAMVSTSSYARRCLTCLVFNVATFGEDNDGNGPLSGTIDAGELAAIEKEYSLLPPPEVERVREAILKFAECEAIEQLPKSKFQAVLKKLRATVDKFHPQQ